MDIFSHRASVGAPYYANISLDVNRQGLIFIDPFEETGFPELGVVSVPLLLSTPWVLSSGTSRQEVPYIDAFHRTFDVFPASGQSPLRKVAAFADGSVQRDIGPSLLVEHGVPQPMKPVELFPSRLCPGILGQGSMFVEDASPDFSYISPASLGVGVVLAGVQQGLGFCFDVGVDVYGTHAVFTLEKDELAFLPVDSGKVLGVSEGVAEAFGEDVVVDVLEDALEGVETKLPVGSQGTTGLYSGILAFEYSCLSEHSLRLDPSAQYRVSDFFAMDSFVPVQVGERLTGSVLPTSVFATGRVVKGMCAETAEFMASVSEGFVYGAQCATNTYAQFNGDRAVTEGYTSVFATGRPIAGVRVGSLVSMGRPIGTVSDVRGISDYGTGVYFSDIVEFDWFEGMDKLSLSAMGVRPRFVDPEDSVLASSSRNEYRRDVSSSGLSLKDFSAGFAGV